MRRLSFIFRMHSADRNNFGKWNRLVVGNSIIIWCWRLIQYKDVILPVKGLLLERKDDPTVVLSPKRDFVWKWNAMFTLIYQTDSWNLSRKLGNLSILFWGNISNGFIQWKSQWLLFVWRDLTWNRIEFDLFGSDIHLSGDICHPV